MALGWWNAHVVVGGAMVGLGWRVVNGGGHTEYEAAITVTLPDGPSFSVQKVAPNETVVMNRDASLSCAANAIEVNVTYLVTPKAGATGNRVEVKIAKVSGQKPQATGQIWAVGSGGIGQAVTVPVVIPGSC